MLVTLLATLMFFVMLAATFNALRREMSQARILVDEPQKADLGKRPTFGTRPW